MSDQVAELADLAVRATELAKRSGAAAAEALCRDGTELTVKLRLGEPELIKEAGIRALGLRVFVGHRAALTYTSDLRAASLEAFVSRSIALAELSEPDELNALPPVEAVPPSQDVLELWDDEVCSIDAARALAMARAAEDAARKADPRVTSSDGARASRTIAAVAFANSAGFVGGYRGTYVSLLVAPICDDAGGKRQRGHAWTASRFMSDLTDPEAVGREAARSAIAKLGARKVESGAVPVVFDPEAGRALVRGLFSVANGSSFYRKASYLIGREGQACASPLVTIVDDPLRPRAPGSRPFDGDGLPSRTNVVIDRGVLRTILCDTYSARRLGRSSTASAGRSVGGSPAPALTNFIMQGGTTPADEIVGSVERGLYVTDMLGFGFNPVTGDFSRGAAGFWIEKGERAFPVTEVTISADFHDLWRRVDAVGDDLALRSTVACPTFRVAEMTVAGR